MSNKEIQDMFDQAEQIVKALPREWLLEALQYIRSIAASKRPASGENKASPPV